MQQVYVLRAEDESCTKIGRTGNLNTRIVNLCSKEKKKYYLVFQTSQLKNAKEIEKQIIDEFAPDRIKGKEYLSTHPLKVIHYIIKITEAPPSNNNLIEMFRAKYDFGIAKSNEYNPLKLIQSNGVRINQKSYEGFVKLVYNNRFMVIWFANLGDANNFATSFKPEIEAVEVIIQLLYGITTKEWIQNKKENNIHPINWTIV